MPRLNLNGTTLPPKPPNYYDPAFFPERNILSELANAEVKISSSIAQRRPQLLQTYIVGFSKSNIYASDTVE